MDNGSFSNSLLKGGSLMKLKRLFIKRLMAVFGEDYWEATVRDVAVVYTNQN